MQKTVSFILLN